ncbi:MAG: hypothetical protein US60_C0022G0008 [Microgenomates group bacterium GW2011_GWC1_37_8]|uniref:SET domain-containing protein n=1 Tax=Candidatus Woesebacteria bacterium GW2011_GWB1_38_8 TaxID=1618570 RepID=A0A0G0L122_9BACT|nr:MAG: hypothetical protein US60_C0022G0008 [Microgenomates group bacterium GW2011_GWC1_37_8]KKQ85633.1 MAG: hypothetical protein UT08_C0005G0084 [Candidatus Woesebacteria bacterium GW2011_GWB1_38_8]
MKPSSKIYLSKSKIPKDGKGVFAAKSIKKGEVIEECPVLVLPKKDYPTVKKTILRNYYFMWGKTTSALCFGYGSFYNHSYQPNATYKKNTKERKIDFVAIKNIAKDKEITVNYNYGKPDEKSTLWIKDIKPAS